MEKTNWQEYYEGVCTYFDVGTEYNCYVTMMTIKRIIALSLILFIHLSKFSLHHCLKTKHNIMSGFSKQIAVAAFECAIQ